jgi:hypothetical protein
MTNLLHYNKSGTQYLKRGLEIDESSSIELKISLICLVI